jgi:uncharacterized protein YfiM (DUF2279 family)
LVLFPRPRFTSPVLGATLVLGLLAATTAVPGRAQSTPDENAKRLRAYHERIVTSSRPLSPSASLAELLVPVMTLAAERSPSSSAADENRAALIAMTLYVNGWNPAILVPDARDWPSAPRRSLGLAGRPDLAQHFIVSAVIAAAAGTPIAAAAGIYKELNDARDGSGFSFSDLAADQAGERFGALATQSDQSAREIQRRVAAGVRDADVMPGIAGLVDNMPDAELQRRFGGVGSPAYNNVIEDITRRVLALALYK